MGLHRDFPEDPFILLDPTIRWFPADESLRQTSSDKLMPPLVTTLDEIQLIMDRLKRAFAALPRPK